MRNKLMIIGMLALVPVAIAAVDLPESFYKQQEQIKLECSVALEDYYRVCCINFDENDDSMIREYLYDIRSSRDKFEEWARAHNVFGDDLKTLKCDFDKELQEVSEKAAKKQIYQALAGFHLGDIYFRSNSFAFTKPERFMNPKSEYNRFQIMIQKQKRICEQEIKAEGCDCSIVTDQLIDYGFSVMRGELKKDRLGQALKERLK